MFDLLPAAALIFAAAITPGPNNIIVMNAAAHGGARSGGRVIGGVIVGSLALLALSVVGVAALIAAQPIAQTVLSWLGAAWLVWTGGVMIIRAGAEEVAHRLSLPGSFLGVAVFQLVNPKAWLLVFAATATAGSLGANGPQAGAVLSLAATLVCITSLCLMAWGLIGVSIGPWLAVRSHRKIFDWVMGAGLVASAALVVM